MRIVEAPVKANFTGTVLPTERWSDLAVEDHERRSRLRGAAGAAHRVLPPEPSRDAQRTGQWVPDHPGQRPRDGSGQPVDVRLDFGGGRTTLTVANRRPGPEASRAILETANGGYGLAGMRERLLLIAGSLLAGPDGGGKWVVTAQVPQ